MALTGIQLSSGIVLGAPKALDAKFGPYAGVTIANNTIPDTLRYKGLTVGILENGEIVEYWYKSGTSNVHLVKKTAVLDENTTTALTELQDKTQNITLDTATNVTYISGDIELNGDVNGAKIDCGLY
jgi:hypothetical protein